MTETCDPFWLTFLILGVKTKTLSNTPKNLSNVSKILVSPLKLLYLKQVYPRLVVVVEVKEAAAAEAPVEVRSNFGQHEELS